MNLSKHFKRSEFACKCGCGFDTADFELVNVLERVREHFGEPVTISSACRCESHNQREGGSKNSQHLLGRAADIVVHGVPADHVHRFLNDYAPNKYGIGKYASFTHIDTRSEKARWDYS